MRQLGLLFALAVCLTLFVSLDCNTQEEEQQNGNGENDYNSTTVSNITLQWKTDTLGMLHVKVSAPTTGWVSVGFHATTGMKDANIIIGYVSGGAASVRDDYGTAPNAHASDVSLGGENNVADLDGTEAGGTTEISFTIPLDSGDAYDRQLIEGNTYSVILAYGEDDDFDSYHTARTSTDIEI
jgi:hypothetical protein